MNQNLQTTPKQNDYSLLPSGAREAIHTVDLALQRVHNITAVGQNITNKIAQTVIEVRQIQFAMQQMDSQVEIMCKEYDMRIEKYKLSAQMIQSQLTNYSVQMDKMLDTILNMDPSNKDQDYIKSRSEMISLLNSTSANISNMFMNFIIY